MHSTRHDKWYGLIVTLDTGTTENWISQAIVERLGFDVSKGLVTKWTTFNGKQILSGSTVAPTWCSQGHGITHVAVFRVVDNCPFDVLFGTNLLFSPEINFFKDERGSHPINCLKEETGKESLILVSKVLDVTRSSCEQSSIKPTFIVLGNRETANREERTGS